MKEIIIGPFVAAYILGHKNNDGEGTLRQITVWGDDTQGYQASYDEYFMPGRNNRNCWEYYETIMETGTYETAKGAYEAIKNDAWKITQTWIGSKR